MRRNIRYFITGLFLLCGIFPTKGRILSHSMLSPEEYPIRSVWPNYGLSTKQRYFSEYSEDYIHWSLSAVHSKVSDINDIEQVKELVFAESFLERIFAIQVLSYKFGKEALPVIKNSIDDPEPRVRCMAARMMAILGDKSGFERMRKDIIEYTQKNKKNDSSSEQNNLSLSMRTRLKRLNHYDAINAAHVLSEFGDSSGFELAKQTASNHDNSIIVRVYAIEVLTELERTIDESTLKEQGIEPEAVLIEIAGSETDTRILQHLIGFVMNNMKPTSQIRILEKLQESTNSSGTILNSAKRNVERSKNQLKLDEQKNN